MNDSGQKVVTLGILVFLGILVIGLFDEPDGSRVQETVPGGGTVMVQGGPVAPVAQTVAMTPPVRVGGNGPALAGRAPPLMQVPGFVAPDPKLAEAHWQGMEALPLSTELKKKLNLPMKLEGVLIDEVSLQSARSGLLAGDVVIAIHQRPVVRLKDFYRESRNVQDLERVSITVYRQGQVQNFQLEAVPGENLGFAQVETAPMILPGDIMPHPYRGPCTDCHAVGTTGHLVPDPDGVILPPPPIKAGVSRPHMDRGPCQACHPIIP
ncbi:MAG: PDZ domain-containing protein [Magnetococcales bacterium]|nr:PDZ domain-containing protein [Magnetococcales bacterium]MBF0148807.1 PDZ domain-containing protein [Magnetococcales bacterium]